MPKAKKGKKPKKAKRPLPLEEPPAFVIDHAYYEEKIAELNRVLAKLRSRSIEVGDKHSELKQKLETLKHDHVDIMIYLNKVLQEASLKLQEKKDELKQAKDDSSNDVEGFKNKIAAMEEEHRGMVDQLESELAMYEGRLGALEEIRLQRNDLMCKFEVQENLMEEQRTRHKNELYEDEKFYTIEKDKLKKRMEARLVQLNKEFQEITEIRLASSMNIQTKRNIRLNNEYNAMLKLDQKLYNKYVQTKNLDDTLRLQMELREKEKEMASEKATRLKNKIEKMTMDYEKMVAKLETYKREEQEMLANQEELKKVKNLIQRMSEKKRIIEQNIEKAREQRDTIIKETEYYESEIERLEAIKEEVLAYIESALTEQASPQIEELLNRLLEILHKDEGFSLRKPSIATVKSVEEIYTIGDLGFVPKPVKAKRRFILKRHRSQQIGPSFHEMQKELAEAAERDLRSLSTRKSSSTLSLPSTESSATPSIRSSEEELPRVSDASFMEFNAYTSSFDAADTRMSIIQILGDDTRVSIAKSPSDLRQQRSSVADAKRESAFASAARRLTDIADSLQTTANLKEDYFGPAPGEGESKEKMSVKENVPKE